MMNEAGYCAVSGDDGLGLIVLCDHASNAIPAAYRGLGLCDIELSRHIAYDIGAREVVLGLAERLGVPAVLSVASRLLIDPNRGEDDPTLIMRLSDGAIIPGNREISAEERAHRLASFYTPYHEAISAAIDRALGQGVVPILLSIHSFTPVWKGVPRPWHAGVLWDKDPRFALPLMSELGRDPDLKVGDNEPYHGRLKGDCLYRHGTSRGLPHAILEIRQDLIADAAGQAAWVDRLAAIMSKILSRRPGSDLGRVMHYGSDAT